MTHNLSAEYTGDLLAAIGNHEGKALLTLAMEPGEPYGHNALHTLLTDRMEGDKTFLGRSSPQAWCKQSIEPFGLATEILDKRPLQFEISEAGITSGQPMAGLLLQIGDRYERALTRIWGATESPGAVRSPMSRFLIISAMLGTEHPLTPGQVNDEVSLGATQVGVQLAAMQRDGVAKYDEWDHVGQDVTFRLPIANTDRVLHGLASPALVSAFDFLRTHHEAALTEIENYCWSQLTKAQRENQERTLFRYKLNAALNDMASSNIVMRTEGRDRSESAYLTPEQRIFWTDIMGKLDVFRQGEPRDLKKFSQYTL